MNSYATRLALAIISTSLLAVIFYAGVGFGNTQPKSKATKLSSVLTKKCGNVTNRSCMETAAKTYLGAKDVIVRVEPLPETSRGIVTIKAAGGNLSHQAVFFFDDAGNVLSDGGEKLENAEIAAWRSKHGKMSKGLAKKVSATKTSKKIPVAIWVKFKKSISKGPKNGHRSSKLDRYSKAAKSRFRNRFRAYHPNLNISGLKGVSKTPVLVGKLPETAIKAIARLSCVAKVYRNPEPTIGGGACDATNEWHESMSATYNDGGDVNACHIGRCKVTKSGSDVNLVGQYDTSSTAQTCSNNHEYWVAGAFSNSGAGPDGTAPAAGSYIANYGGNPSWGKTVADGCGSNEYPIWTNSYSPNTAHERFLDYWATRSPYPTIFQLSGNDVPNKNNCQDYNNDGTANGVWTYAYNSIIVNASDDHDTADTSDDELVDCNWHGCWGNPCTGGGFEFCPNGDRELPHVVAPGNDLQYLNGTVFGTSMATPAAAGAAAQIMTADSTSALEVWPEANRALLMATAGQDVDPTDNCTFDSDDSVEDKDGAGLIDAHSASYVASNSKMDEGNSSNPTTQGFDYQWLDFSDKCDYSGATCYKYYVDTGSWDGDLTFAISWDSTSTCSDEDDPTSCSEDHLDADLDINVYKKGTGSWVTTSASKDNAYEFVNLPKFDGTYEVRIVMASDTPAESSTYLGVAWDQPWKKCQ